MHRADLIVDTAWALPIAPLNHVVANHSIAVGDSRILAFGPRAAIHETFAGTRNVAVAHGVMLPGLVNAHGHAAMTLLRGVADDAPFDAWLNDTIWPLEARWMSPEFVADGTDLAIAEMLKSGTTCFSDMYFFPEVSASRARAAHIRAQVCFPILRFANAWASGPADAFHKGLALLDGCRNDPLVRIGFGPHAVYSVDRAELTKIAMLAEELDAPVQIHLHETAAEVQTMLRTDGVSPLALLHNIGFLSPRVQAVHLTSADDADLDRLARSGAGVVHCPQSNLKLSSGFCRVQRLTDLGIPWALGTDGAASNNGLDLLQEARVAMLLARAVGLDPATGRSRAPDTLMLLEAATLGGARVLGLGDEVGSLEAGKRADFIVVDLDDVALLPVHRPEAQLLFNGSGAFVSHVWVGGRPVVEDGALLTMDVGDIKARARRWAERISAGKAAP